MRTRFPRLVGGLAVLLLPLACVDPEDILLRGTVDVLVVDGTITNGAEPQLIKLNRSTADRLTGLLGTTPIRGATLQVIEDSSLVIASHETTAGSYQLPADFRGRVGHTYQLRFVLPGGEQYQSNAQTMPPAPPIERVYARFNPSSLNSTLLQGFSAAHDVYVDLQDPQGETNFYRWDWKLWETQGVCRTCVQGRYSINNVLTQYAANGFRYFTTGDSLFENCFYPPADDPSASQYFAYDYPCRTHCWALFYSHDLHVFADTYSNGRLITGRQVAQIPYYQHSPCLVEIRQSALTPSAYQYFRQLADQTQKTGGVADIPPAALGGNVHNLADSREGIVGFFTAAAVATSPYWLDRKDATGIPLGATDPAGGSGVLGAELFYALSKRQPLLEPSPPTGPAFQILGKAQPQPTAICESTERQTPVKPIGWRD
ncbi:DUF4249 domain-containing protein [Spirosoma endophyticum]|uniref:DUF4249 domain-containing protein n=1 Tax=Spirosoma endophyticum TaxID=662367 RepID=A0A1I2EV12_9BACT|nr:DUF4249 domain-containing protein [Spirosoma endophyticum]SFE96060.1 protein of unknown function [Spirosoma endophyticum]